MKRLIVMFAATLVAACGNDQGPVTAPVADWEAPAASAPPTTAAQETQCVPRQSLVDKAETFRAQNHRPPGYGRSWRQILLFFGVESDYNTTDPVEPVTVEQLVTREGRWSGWREFRVEAERLLACGWTPGGLTTGPVEEGTAEPQQEEPQQEEPQQEEPLQAEPQQAPSCNLTQATSEAKGAFIWHRDKNNTQQRNFFYRVLRRFGEEGAFTAPTGVSPVPVTVAEARTTRGDETWTGWQPIIAALECLGDPETFTLDTNPDEGLSVVFDPKAIEHGCATGRGTVTDIVWSRYSTAIPSSTIRLGDGTGRTPGGVADRQEAEEDPSDSVRAYGIAPSDTGYCLLHGIKARIGDRTEAGDENHTIALMRARVWLLGLPSSRLPGAGSDDQTPPMTVAEAETHAGKDPDWWDPIVAAMKVMDGNRATHNPFPRSLTIGLEITQRSGFLGNWRSTRVYSTGDLVWDYNSYFRAVRQTSARPLWSSDWTRLATMPVLNASQIRITHTSNSRTTLEVTGGGAATPGQTTVDVAPGWIPARGTTISVSCSGGAGSVTVSHAFVGATATLDVCFP